MEELEEADGGNKGGLSSDWLTKGGCGVEVDVPRAVSNVWLPSLLSLGFLYKLQIQAIHQRDTTVKWQWSITLSIQPMPFFYKDTRSDWYNITIN